MAENGKKIYVRICPICGTEFRSPSHTQRYCGIECKMKAKHEAQNAYREKKKRKRVSTLNEDIRAADASGLSYGRWQALKRLEDKE